MKSVDFIKYFTFVNFRYFYLKIKNFLSCEDRKQLLSIYFRLKSQLDLNECVLYVTYKNKQLIVKDAKFLLVFRELPVMTFYFDKTDFNQVSFFLQLLTGLWVINLFHQLLYKKYDMTANSIRFILHKMKTLGLLLKEMCDMKEKILVSLDKLLKTQ